MTDGQNLAIGFFTDAMRINNRTTKSRLMRGQLALEYVLLIAVTVIAVLLVFFKSNTGFFSKINQHDTGNGIYGHFRTAARFITGTTSGY